MEAAKAYRFRRSLFLTGATGVSIVALWFYFGFGQSLIRGSLTATDTFQIIGLTVGMIAFRVVYLSATKGFSLPELAWAEIAYVGVVLLMMASGASASALVIGLLLMLSGAQFVKLHLGLHPDGGAQFPSVGDHEDIQRAVNAYLIFLGPETWHKKQLTRAEVVSWLESNSVGCAKVHVGRVFRIRLGYMRPVLKVRLQHNQLGSVTSVMVEQWRWGRKQAWVTEDSFNGRVSLTTSSDIRDQEDGDGDPNRAAELIRRLLRTI